VSAEAQQLIVGAGGVAALVAAARSTADDTQAQAAVALMLAHLALPPHTEAVAAGGATPVLIGSLSLQGGGSELTLAAAAALQHLVRTVKGRAEIIAGGIASCVGLLQPRALSLPMQPAEQVALHQAVLTVLEEALTAEDGGDVAVSLEDLGGASFVHVCVTVRA
jgi:hypothetical protein